MFCPQCGTQNDDSAMHCANCGVALQMGAPEMAPQQPMPYAERPPNYLVQAILVTIFCCMPFGIVAIIFAAQVDGKAASGDIEGACDYSNKARMWCLVSLGLGLIIPILYIGMMILAGIVGALG